MRSGTMFWLSPRVSTIRDLLEEQGAQSVANKYGRKACRSLLELIRASTTSTTILSLGIESLALISERSASADLMSLIVHGEPSLRKRISEAIQTSQGASIDKWLASILNDDHCQNTTRACAAELLGFRSNTENQSVLIEVFRHCDPDNHVLISALIEAIERSGWRPSEFETFLLSILHNYLEQEMVVRAALGRLVRALHGQTHDLKAPSPVVQILDTLARIGGAQSLEILRGLQDRVRCGALLDPSRDEAAIAQKARKGGITDGVALGIFRDDYRSDRNAVLEHLSKAVQQLEARGLRGQHTNFGDSH
jgi:hypothetical protein